jgi:hypothetical protein
MTNNLRSIIFYAGVGVLGLLNSASTAKAQQNKPVYHTLGEVKVTDFATGFASPSGIVYGADGNFYVIDYYSNDVSKVTPSGVVSTFATGVSAPEAITADRDSNIYVLNSVGSGNSVSKITPDGTITTIASGFGPSYGLTWANDGNLYATEISEGIVKITPSGAITTFVSRLSSPVGISQGIDSNFYVGSNFGNLYKISQSGTVTTVTTSIRVPRSVVQNKFGDLFVVDGNSDNNNNVIKVYSDGSSSLLASGIDGLLYSIAIAIAIDDDDALYIPNYSRGKILKVTQKIEACDSYVFAGKTITQSGTYFDTIPNGAASGADSIVIVNLVIKHTSTSQHNESFCYGTSFTFNQKTYTQSGTYYDTIPNVAGCDSIITLTLTERDELNPVVSQNGNTLSLTTAFNTYQWLKNNEVIADATLQTYDVTSDGNYSVYVSDEFGCSDTSAAIQVTYTGINEAGSFHNFVSLYPNPTNGELNIRAQANTTIQVFSLQGQEVFNGVMTNETTTLNLGLHAGLYIVRLTNKAGESAIEKITIK